MRDFKLKPGADWASSVVLYMTLPDHPALRESAVILARNVERVQRFSTLLSNLIIPIIVSERATAKAARGYDNSSDVPLEEFISRSVASELTKHAEDLDRMNKTRHPSREYIALVDAAYGYVQRVSSDNEKTSDALESWFAAQLTGVWTAIESLFQDLWVAALNAHPATLAELKGRSDKKTVSLARLAQANFEINGAMGTILSEYQNFSRLDKVVEAYALAFSQDGDSIIGLLKGPEFHQLSCIRNLIVHAASRFDGEYLSKVQSLPDAPRGELGEKMQLDGEVVDRTLRPVLIRALELITAVDQWLQTH
ncbi:hypothetical protein HFO63_10195 [Rhizobium laguerreae]|uniref:RiboL-PSP-HEPN domain-containing protein n=3 Tax=Rhizobium laguerreae TaxID=1076926 RepID=A0AB35FKF6_9HYPH|nr:hypothetical protein [Rhizobium laguerreae]MBY3067272.1 hypothetical protein [Rhizobium laguerreae]MBY3080367.1 hypothetical protein [Rhizobium laguerreae]MBY3086497.1 hypothetical protein [Rhizobium laguerreae]MBY3113632.1 hypothetical protein [Rhizobium laguerreae]MBY3145955.1 hypothetical protein [Rhizobium laguerreae]